MAIKTYNLSGVKDLAGNALSLSGAPYQPAGTLVVDTKTAAADTIAPNVQWVAATGSKLQNGTGTVSAGDTVRLSVNFNEVVTVNGTPTLSLSSNGTAKYVSGAGTNTLQFDYKVQAGEKASDLEISGYNLNGVKDRAGNAVNVSGAPHQPGGTLTVGGTSVATTAVSQQATLAATTDIAAPAAATAVTDAASTTSSTNWFGGGHHGSGFDFSFGNRRTVGYPGSQDSGASATPPQGSAMSKLALLDQYAASSFATPASTTTGSVQGWLNNTAQTLAKPQA